MYPGWSQSLLELGEAHNIDVDELHHFVSLCRAAGLVPHHLLHDPARREALMKYAKREKL